MVIRTRTTVDPDLAIRDALASQKIQLARNLIAWIPSKLKMPTFSDVNVEATRAEVQDLLIQLDVHDIEVIPMNHQYAGYSLPQLLMAEFDVMIWVNKESLPVTLPLQIAIVS